MATFTKLIEADIHAIAARYQLKVVKYEPVEQGAGNTNYLLYTDFGKYILTILEVDDTQVINMTRVLLHLEKINFPALPLQKNSTGEILSKFQGKTVLVRPFISGSVVMELDPGMVKQVGTALARLHEVPPPEYLPELHTYERKFYQEILLQKIDEEYKGWVRQRYQFINEHTPSNLPIGLVHGDLFFDNILFENGKLKALLDFEDLCRIGRIFDLGMTAVGICVSGTDLEIHKVKALVEGYQEVLTLEDAEKEFFQLSIEWSAIMTSVWRFWKYNIESPDPAKSKHFLKMVEIAKNTLAIQPDQFKNSVFP